MNNWEPCLCRECSRTTPHETRYLNLNTMEETTEEDEKGEEVLVCMYCGELRD